MRAISTTTNGGAGGPAGEPARCARVELRGFEPLTP